MSKEFNIEGFLHRWHDMHCNSVWQWNALNVLIVIFCVQQMIHLVL